ncbi:hypothetical protein B0H14DRAFT_3478936 [Mycena olivaceomarginata]|nr:hypothetical protein B0H14DRAFT_3478936 [Mycena olivaceomarginata]
MPYGDILPYPNIIEHSNRPLMSDISRDILEPMYQAFLVIHADAIWNPEMKSAEERRFMREKTRIYLELAGKLSDLLILHRGLASAFRVPAPRVAWLLSVMRADQLYGFSGDEPARRTLWHKAQRRWRLCPKAKTYQDGMMGIDAEPSGTAVLLSSLSIEMSRSGFFVARTVAQAIAIPPLLYTLLESFRSAEVNRDNYCGSPFGEVAYARNFLCPFAHVIRSSIPSTVCVPDDMPFGRASELEKYVVVYIKRAALLYAISFEVSRRSGQPMMLDPSLPTFPENPVMEDPSRTSELVLSLVQMVRRGHEAMSGA